MSEVRVLHILHSMNRGGAENAIMNYYRHIERNKVQFDFLLTEPSKCQFEDEIVLLGGRVFRVPLLTISNPFHYLKAVSSFFDEHPEYKIVHSHTSSKSFFPLWVAKQKSIPVRIAHSHNTKSERGFRGWIRNFLKIGLKKVATHYFACSEEAAYWLYGKSFYKKGKVIILHNVIETSRFCFNKDVREAVRKRLSVEEDILMIGCVGRFFRQKNLLFAIDVFKEIYIIDKKVYLLLVGDGELRKEIETHIAKYGLGSRVVLTGIVANVSELLQAMDLFLMPSFFEGLPVSLVEAQASGLKCFASTGIPSESNMTGLVTFVPLAVGAKKWAELLWSQRGYVRNSRTKELIDAGYDAETTAKELQNFYLDNYKKSTDVIL